MKVALITLCIFLGLAVKVQAQNYFIGPSISYQYQKGSIVKAGAFYTTDIGASNVLKLETTANFTWTQGKYAVIPEVAATYYLDMYYIGFFGRTELTPYTASPKVGFSILTIVEIDFGYGIPLATKTDYRPIEGFTTSLRFTIPLNSKL